MTPIHCWLKKAHFHEIVPSVIHGHAKQFFCSLWSRLVKATVICHFVASQGEYLCHSPMDALGSNKVSAYYNQHAIAKIPKVPVKTPPTNAPQQIIAKLSLLCQSSNFPDFCTLIDLLISCCGFSPIITMSICTSVWPFFSADKYSMGLQWHSVKGEYSILGLA